MAHYAIAGIQMHIGMQNNVDQMTKRLEVLMHIYPWVQMVVFSELAPHGPSLPSAQPTGGSLEESLREVARRFDIWLVPGSIFENREGRIYNTTPVINPQGEVVTRYRKIYPFQPYENGVTPGEDFCVFDVPDVGRFGVSICYDIWFPEVTRTLTAMGAEVILNPVLAHFIDRPADLAIAQASGAMFQSYIFHINGLMAGGNGYSTVVDPAGRMLHEGSVGEEMIPVEVDFDLVRRQRVRGLLGMGQPIKSFRDKATAYPVYQPDFDRRYLDSLGVLQKQEREMPGEDGGKAPLPATVMPLPDSAL